MFRRLQLKTQFISKSGFQSWKPLPPTKRLARPQRNMTQVVTMETVHLNKPVAYWLFGCAGMVAGMVTIGGITRITRSGLSMVEWKPHGSLPPVTRSDWEAEFEKYKQFPAYQQRQNMTLEEFQSIFWWEYGHRMMGRVLGLCFVVPMTYFAIRKRIPQELKGRIGLLFGLGATQGAIGWWMVKSGLKKPAEDHKREIRVSPYRLATHLGFAFTTYGVLLWTAMDILRPKSFAELDRGIVSPDVLKRAKQIRGLAHASAGLLGITILSGAFMAGIDAGKAYNTFPKMGDQWIPDEILSLKPLYRNFFEETATVQFDHRMLALGTTSGILAMYGLARNKNVWSQLPSTTKLALTTSLGALVTQVGLGISTLVTCVPTDLAITHQAGSLALFSSLLWTMHTLRFAKL